MDKDTPKDLLKVYKYAFKLKKGGSTPAEIKQELLNQGFDQHTAGGIAANIDVYYNEKRKKRSKKNILYGIIWLAGGGVIAIVAYNNAYKGIGYYLLVWGVILFGVLRFLMGIISRV